MWKAFAKKLPDSMPSRGVGHILANPWRSLAAIAVIFGMAVRLSLFFGKRSLWFDELGIAMNLRDRSYLELLAPLDHNQAAPPLFLWIEKLAIQLLGESELALRLFPLLAGITSLLLLYRLAFRTVSEPAAAIAVALLAVLRFTVYYSNELKPYIVDLSVSLLLFSILWGFRQQAFGWTQTLWVSFVGALCIWTSFPAAFTLVAAESTVLFANPVSLYWRLFKSRLLTYAVWIASFVGMYWFSVAAAMGNSALVDSWSARYPDSLFDVVWLLDAVGRFFYRPLGFIGVPEVLAMLTFVVGCIVLWRNNRLTAIALLSPFVVTLAASFLQKYPFRERLILYLVPYALLIISSGLAWTLNIVKRPRYIQVLGVVLLCVLWMPSAGRSLAIIINPHQYSVHRLRPLIEYVNEHYVENDVIYVFPRAQRAFEYYTVDYPHLRESSILPTIGLEPDDVANRKQAIDELLQVRGNSRVWLMGTELDPEKGELDIVLSDLNLVGTQLDLKQLSDAATALYDFSLAPKSVDLTENNTNSLEK